MKHLQYVFLFLMVFSSPYLRAGEKPGVVILATGGTIAGSADSNTDMTGYTAGTLGVDILIAAVPEMQGYAEISGEQISNIGSDAMNDEVWLSLARRCNEILSGDAAGIVITHGTDTLEETAYFLNLVVKSDKPVVLVGAARPATGISADGPINLLNAVRLAVNPEAVGKGVMIAMNDEINSARDVSKTNTTTVSTFKAPELGLLGYFIDGRPVFYRSPLRKHTKNSEFDVSSLEALPRVAIVYATSGMESDLVESYAALDDMKGLVWAGTGMGSIPDSALPGIQKAMAGGVTVVRGSRCGNGIVPSTDKWLKDNNIASTDNLSPQKARILLKLALTKTSDAEDVQRIFDEY